MRENQIYLLRFRPNTVEESFDTKYLGVNLQSNLSWDKHIRNINQNVFSAIGRFINKFNTQTKLLIYTSLMQSHFNYFGTETMNLDLSNASKIRH